MSYTSKTAKMMNGDTLFQQHVDIVFAIFDVYVTVIT